MITAQDISPGLAAIVWEAQQSPWRLLQVGPRAASLGFPASAWIDDPGFLAAHLHPQDRERVMAAARALSEGESRMIGLRLQSSGGRFVPMSTILQGLPGGRVLGLMVECDARDAAASEQLGAILDAVADGITVQDRTMAILMANDAAARACGYPTARALVTAGHEEIVRKFQLWDEAGKPLRFEELPAMVALAEGRESERLLRFQVIGAVDDDHWVVLKARPITDSAGVVQLAVNIFHDETDRIRKAEHARFLAEAGTALAASLDVSETAACLARLPVPALAARSLVYLDPGDGGLQLASAHGEAESGLAIAPTHALRSQQRSELVEIERQHVLMLPLRARGRALGVLVLTRPMEQPPFPAHVVELAEDLAERAALYLDNAGHFADAQRAVASRDDFLAIASHDLKSPLGAVLFSASVLLRSQQGGEEWDRVRRTADSILKAAETMERLVHDLVDLAALDAGRLSVDKRHVPVDELVTHALKLYEPLAAERSVSLRAQVPPGGMDVVCDRGRIEQVLGNLIANAVAHAPQDSAVLVTVERRGSHARFSVIDHGSGIGADILPHVFDRYTRGPSHGRRSTGLGLSIAEGLVKAHGGRIWVESVTGRGATFHFTVPLT